MTTNTNGNGQHQTEPETDTTGEVVDVVLLAGLVALLQVARMATLSKLESDAIVFACSTLDQALEGMDTSARAEWRRRTRLLLREEQALEEGNQG